MTRPAKDRPTEQRFWLLVLDAIAIVPGGFGSRAYDWALERAAECTDWGECADGSGESGEETW